MKRVTVVCLAAEREAAVAALREVGTVHVLPSLPPASDALDRLVRRRENLERVLALLEARPAVGSPVGVAPVAADPAALVDRVQALTSEQSAAEERRQKLLRAAQALAPWGSFSREDVAACQAAGLQVVLVAVAADALPVWPAGTVVTELSRQGKTIYLAVVAAAGVALPVTASAFPESTDGAEIESERREVEAELRRVSAELDHLAATVPSLRQAAADLDEQVALARARDGMGQSEPLTYLEGYVPVRDLDSLLAAARRYGWAVRAVDPAADDLNVPTKLRLARWVEPIRSVFQTLGILPGYREVDISACFLLFFSVFFAMLIGDAGYGVVLLALTLGLRWKYRQAPAAPFWLFVVLSVSTIVWGVLTGTYFAIHLPDGHPLRAIPSVSYFAEVRNVQRLCFLIGTIHLTVAHVWNAAVTRPWLKAVGALAWIPILWGNYLLAKMMVLGAPTHPALPWLYGGGLLGVLLFTEPSLNPFRTVGLGLGKIALNLANSFVDVVSYVRLFAVGAAGVKVAESMNEMAGAIHGMPWLGGLLATLVLVLGHAFNLLLGSMGVLVHGVRLNVLEFAGHVGLEFAGSAYRPLRRRQVAAADGPGSSS
jgi:V/A-type H+-transporting ATPase subunit I